MTPRTDAMTLTITGDLMTSDQNQHTARLARRWPCSFRRPTPGRLPAARPEPRTRNGVS